MHCIWQKNGLEIAQSMIFLLKQSFYLHTFYKQQLANNLKDLSPEKKKIASKQVTSVL